MCFIDTDGMGARSPLSRRGFLGGLVAGAAAESVGGSLVRPGVAEGAEPAPAGGGPGAAGVSFKWFGTNGWEITFGNKTILVDPWFNRFESGFLQNKLNHDTLLPTDTALIDQHVKKADQILVGHGHWDHMADVPYIAKKTGAMVVGSETHANVMRAAGVPEGKIVQVKGGEYMQFDGYSIELFPSAHSIGRTNTYPAPCKLVSVPASPPTKDGDQQDDYTLTHMIRLAWK